MRLCALLFRVCCLLVASSPAFAHRPYYTQVEKIRLPNGDIGEVRLLNGDEIMVADPVRAVIVDPQNKLLALSPKTHAMAVSCDADRHCLIVDLIHDRVFELDPATFASGPTQPSVSPGERTEDWDLESASGNWGFVVRAATGSERWAANWTFANETRAASILVVILGALGGVCLVPIRLSVATPRFRLLLQSILFVGGLLVFMGLAGFVFLMVVVGGGSLDFSLLAFVVGACFSWFATRAIGRR